MSNKEKESSKKDFISEAEEIIEELTSDIQQLEESHKRNQVRPELINRIFRRFHSLKGISGMLGFEKVSTFTHELENMLDKLRLGKVSLSSRTLDILFAALDQLNAMIREINDGESAPETTSLTRRISELVSADTAPPETISFPELTLDEQTVRSFTEYEEHRLRENIRKDIEIYSVRLILDNTTFDQELRDCLHILSQQGEVISTLPSFDVAAGPDKMIFRLIVSTAESPEALLQKLHRQQDVQITNIRRTSKLPPIQLVETTTEEEQDTDRSIEASLRSVSQTVRVDIHKLDEIINVIGELLITKAMIHTISRELTGGEHRATGSPLMRASVDLEKKLNELQRSVVETRLVPVGQIYHKLARMVRKLSRETSKQVDLQFSGEDTKLDKIMIEQLSDPLMHIIRNAFDHGIEPSEERRRQGKPDNGLIRLSAFQRGNNVVIRIQDDGRGIQLKRIADKARRRGLMQKEETLDMKKCIDLIFSPGFSSSEEVTELSGRGVGLDVVKKNIAELKGTINVLTEEGRGSLFEICLPITLAIIQALIVKIHGSKYAIPLSSVSEIVRIYSRDIRTVDHREVYSLRGKTLPLIRVGDVFNLKNAIRKEKLFVVIVDMPDQSMGLVVDELAGQQEIVIKSMGEKLKNIPGIAGATEIGEKKPVLVIDAESMIEEVIHKKFRAV